MHDERRAAILRAAERLLRLYGPAKTTVADVAREAAVGVGTVYLEFTSKDTLIEELAGAHHAAVLGAMRAEAEVSGRPARDRLRAALDARVEAFVALASEGARAAEMFQCPSAPVRAARERFHEAERALVAGLLREGARGGEFDAPKPEASARALLQAYVCFSPPLLFQTPRDELGPRLRAVHDLVFFGLIARRAKAR